MLVIYKSIPASELSFLLTFSVEDIEAELSGTFLEATAKFKPRKS
jgi:hypothetical protein